MNHLLICGAAGYTNLGDDAILWGMLTQLRSVIGDRPIVVAGGPALGPLVATFGATAISYENRTELARAIEGAALVIIGGGGVFYDVRYDAGLARLLSAPEPGEHWLYQFARIACAARAAGRPLMLYGIGAGPLFTEAACQTARFIGEQAQAITVRDQASAELLAECGLARTRLHVAADPAVLVTPGASEGVEKLLTQSGLAAAPRPWIGVNLRPWYCFGEAADTGKESFDRLLARAAEMVRGIRAKLGGTAVLLPFQTLNDDDSEVLREVARLAGQEAGAVLLATPTLPPDLVSLISHLDVMVGMRLHSLLLACNAGVPFVALAYDDKVRAFAQAAGMDAHVYSTDTFEAGQALSSCETLLRDREAVSAQLRARNEELQRAAGLSSELAAELLTQGRTLRRAEAASPARVKPASELRVLMQIRPEYADRPHGDHVQLAQTKRYLEAMGLTIEVSAEREPDLADYDLVHAFNLGHPEELQWMCLNAVQQGKPIALSTIYADLGEFKEWGQVSSWELPPPDKGLPQPRPAPPPDAIERRRLARLDQQRQAIVDWATVYLPNGQGEADQVHQNFGMDYSRTVIVPNGVMERFFEARPEPFIEKYGLRDFVLCAARVEERKNQLSLVAALRGTGLPLVIIGQPLTEEYLELCRRYADENVVFLDAFEQQDLASAYAAAKVHALVSWYETPGISTLEAAAAGCNVVSTDRGTAREYLGELGWYCDPKDIASIREAVLQAYQAPRSPQLKEHIRANFTWRHAAEQTLKGYQLALSLHQGRKAGEQEELARAAARRHAEWLARLAADRLEWAQQVQAEYDRVTSRLLYRWSVPFAHAGWKLLRKLGIKR